MLQVSMYVTGEHRLKVSGDFGLLACALAWRAPLAWRAVLARRAAYPCRWREPNATYFQFLPNYASKAEAFGTQFALLNWRFILPPI